MDSPNLDRVLRIKTNSCRGGIIENINVRNIKVGQCGEAVLKINTDYEPREICCRGFYPTVRNVTMENVTCQKSKYGVMIVGYEDPKLAYTVNNITALFVIVFKLDVAGVAIATIISQALSAVLITIALFRYHGFFHFSLKELRIHKKEFLEVMVVGLPAGIQNSIFSISNMVLQSSVNGLGLAVISGYGASSSIEGFGLTAMNAFGQAAMVFIAANMGAKRMENVKKLILISFLYIVLTNVVMAGLLLPLSKPLLSLYVLKQEDPLRSDSIYQGQIKLFIIVITQFLCGTMHLFAFSMRGLGKSTTPMLSTLISICGFRLFWIYAIFNNVPKLQNIFGVAISYPISWIFTASINLIFLIVFYKKAYLNYNKECEELVLDAKTQE